MEVQSRQVANPLRPVIAAAPAPVQPAVKMAADTFSAGAAAVTEPVARLVDSVDNKKQFNKVTTDQEADVFAARTSAQVPFTVKRVTDAGKAAAKALSTKTTVAPAGPTGLWAKVGTGLGVLDIGAGLYQTLTGISELRVGKKRDGLVDVAGGAAFAGSSALYLAGSTVLGPLAAAASCFIPGANQLAYGLQEHDRSKQISAGILLAGGAGFTALGVMAMTGLGAGATILGMPLAAALGIGTSAALIGRAVVGNWGAIKDLAGGIAKKLGF
jgi:hypothetical protein